MKVYIDIFTGDELMSDSYKQLAPLGEESLSNVAFEVQSRNVEKGEDDYGISANVDEDAGEGATGDAYGAGKEIVVDIIDKFNLQEQRVQKKEFVGYIKKFLKFVCDHLEANEPDRVEPFKAGLSLLVQKIVSNYDDYRFYIGPEAIEGFTEFKAHPIMAYYKDGELAPAFIFIKDALREQKY